MSQSVNIIGYIDPASGAIILQVIVAAVLTMGVAFRRILFAPLSVFRRRQSDGDESAKNE